MPFTVKNTAERVMRAMRGGAVDPQKTGELICSGLVQDQAFDWIMQGLSCAKLIAHTVPVTGGEQPYGIPKSVVAGGF